MADTYVNDSIGRERQVAALKYLHEHCWNAPQWPIFEALVHAAPSELSRPLPGHIAAVRQFMLADFCLSPMSTLGRDNNPFRNNTLWKKFEKDIHCLPWIFAAHVNPINWPTATTNKMYREYVATNFPAFTASPQNLVSELITLDIESVRGEYLYGGPTDNFDVPLVVPLHVVRHPILATVAGTDAAVVAITEGVAPYRVDLGDNAPDYLTVEDGTLHLKPPANTANASGSQTITVRDSAGQKGTTNLTWSVVERNQS